MKVELVITPDQGDAVRYEFPQVEDWALHIDPRYRYVPAAKAGILSFPEIPILAGAGVQVNFEAKPLQSQPMDNHYIYRFESVKP